jgi:acyl-coenzyme A synthetase/AMP-(fatty) acid ligase
VARADAEGVAIAAFVALKPGHKKSIIAMKRHCTLYLPHAMVPDTITFLDVLPATSTGKVDYPRLKTLATQSPCLIPGGRASRRAHPQGGSDGASPSQIHATSFSEGPST